MNYTQSENLFVTYVRTLQLLKIRLKGIDENEAVYISQKEIEKRFFVYPDHNRKHELEQLVKNGDVEISESINKKTKRKIFLFKALRLGGFDFSLIQKSELDSLTSEMMKNLSHVSLSINIIPTIFFDEFLKNKNKYLELFLKVDKFSGRVHTPITNLKREIRKNILIDEQPTVGLDVTTMQPIILGKILNQYIGLNQFSSWIDSGEDVYIMLQKLSKFQTRDQGKKRFFEILFAPPSNELAKIFGQSNWINWINEYKEKNIQDNPHTVFKPHSNLAWLLQSTEVKIMRNVWQALALEGICFLSVHDEIIIKKEDTPKAESLFYQILQKEFSYFSLNVK